MVDLEKPVLGGDERDAYDYEREQVCVAGRCLLRIGDSTGKQEKLRLELSRALDAILPVAANTEQEQLTCVEVQ